jgi:hypothetical protein
LSDKKGSLEQPVNLAQYVKRSMEQEAINLLIAVRTKPDKEIKKIAETIGTLGGSLR